MNGPEHYRKAEERLKEAGEAPEGSSVENFLLASAQVHATLALAAVTAHHIVATSVDDREGWSKAIGSDGQSDVSANTW